MMRSDDELTPGELEAIGRLSRAAHPPAGLEQATVDALAARGLLRRPRRRFLATAALAASVALLAAGLAIGRFEDGSGPVPPRDDRPRFALFLYEGSDYRPAPAGQGADRVREYVAWARADRAGGAVEGGEKLVDGADLAIASDGSTEVVVPRPDAARLAGYFLIRADDREAAAAIARSCPHLRYGGSALLRQIDPT